MMAGIRGKDTKAELLVRKGLHRRGYRYVLHDKRLPGKPDLVLPKYRAVIFVHGCFWHGHDCHLFKWPKSREDFWRAKIEGNRERDTRAVEALIADNWRVMVVWECAFKGKSIDEIETTLSSVAKWLQSSRTHGEIRGK